MIDRLQNNSNVSWVSFMLYLRVPEYSSIALYPKALLFTLIVTASITWARHLVSTLSIP